MFQALAAFLCLQLVACGASLGPPPDQADTDAGSGLNDGSNADGLIDYIPSNVPASHFSAGEARVDIALDITLNTDTGVVSGPGAGAVTSDSHFDIIQQGPNAPSLGVFSWASLTVASGVTISVEGTNALVLVIRENATINGLIDVSGGRGVLSAAGPGGYRGGNNTSQLGSGLGGGASRNYDAGGGGGGYADIGGVGGNHEGDPGGVAGPATGTESNVPLLGGSGGGRGGNGGTGSGNGGGGGGAFQLSARGEVRFGLGSGVNAGGGAGLGGSNDRGGGGGGAGGAILIEARHVVLEDGTLSVNGGGGGAGANRGNRGADGQVGQFSATAAAGGNAAGEGSAGGSGAAGTNLAGSPGEPVSAGNTGGGGGAGGRIYLRTRQQLSISAMSVISPTGSLVSGTL